MVGEEKKRTRNRGKREIEIRGCERKEGGREKRNEEKRERESRREKE